MPQPDTDIADMLLTETVHTIREADSDQWNTLAGPDDFYQSHEWLSAVERDRTAQCRYLLSWHSGELVGALPLYRVTFEGSPPYRPDRLRALLGVDGEYLIAGGRRCYRSTVLLAPYLSTDAKEKVTTELLRRALEIAAEDGLDGVILPYLPTSVVERIGRSMPVTVAYDSAEATVTGVGSGLDEYLQCLSGKRRHTARKEMAKYAAAGWHTRTEQLADCLSEAARLVSLVEQRHGRDTPDIVLRRVFRRQVEAADHRAVVFTCRDDQHRMIACSINYAWQNTLYNRSIGLDYERLKDSFEYFNLLIYRAVVHASEHRLNRLHLSIQPSRAKLQRGAVVSPLWTAAIHHPSAAGSPGVHVVDPDAMSRWTESESLSSFVSAFPAERWRLPGTLRSAVRRH